MGMRKVKDRMEKAYAEADQDLKKKKKDLTGSDYAGKGKHSKSDQYNRMPVRATSK
jgi:hypothetical protein